MDIQSTDGYGMLLRYVLSYVKKMQDDCIGDAFYDTDVNTRNAAFRFVATNHPSEPEMWLLLSNFKYCRHSGITKHLTVPRHNDCEAHKVTQKYLARPQTAHDMSLIEFHHTHVTSSEDLHPYRGGRSSSIACKTVSPHKSEFLFQHTLLHVPFHSYHDFLPATLMTFHKYFSATPLQSKTTLPYEPTTTPSLTSVTAADSRNTKFLPFYISFITFPTLTTNGFTTPSIQKTSASHPLLVAFLTTSTPTKPASSTLSPTGCKPCVTQTTFPHTSSNLACPFTDSLTWISTSSWSVPLAFCLHVQVRVW